MSLPDDTLLLDAATAPKRPDLRVTIIYNTFLVHLIVLSVCIFLGSIPYFNYLGRHVTHVVLLSFLAFLMLSFLVLCFVVSRQWTYYIIGTLGVFTVSLCGAVGFASATLYNLSPIQLLIIAWAQSLGIILYTQLSPHNLEMYKTMAFLFTASIVAWIVSIYTFIVEQEYWQSIVILICAIPLAFYNVYFIEKTNGRFDASFEQGVQAIGEYFCLGLI
jgi:hypothetical protein